jgi:D-amino-acid dehydrogenase
MAKIGIIGGGISGLMAAYYLQKDGHEVHVLDRGDFSEGCSHGNAGMIVPSHIIPLAAPGVVMKGLKWLLDKKSPFTIVPSLDKDLIYWLFAFHRAATEAKVQRAIPQLAALSLLSKKLYQEIAAAGEVQLDLQEKGILMLCQTAPTEHEEREVARLANAQGIQAIPMTPDELAALDPSVRYTVRSAVYYPGDAVIDPAVAMSSLLNDLQQKGLVFWPHTEVTGFRCGKDSILALQCADGERSYDHYVLCGGAWSGMLMKSIGLRLPVTGGKGYSFVQNNAAGLSIPSLLLDHRVSVTPYGQAVRFGGTMELGRLNPLLNMAKVSGIHSAIRQYFADWKSPEPTLQEVWHGFRPCSPDGLPYLGTTQKYGNLHIAAGHGMMGVSLAPASGKIIADLVQGLTPELEQMHAFRPERYVEKR